jgi:hypothetical protein
MVFLIPGLLSCAHNDNKARSENLIKKEVLDVVIKYARDKFIEPKETVAQDGIVTVVEKQVNFVTPSAYQTRYVIDPSKIVIGLIDDDTNEDAIINITSIRGQDMETPENLIFIKADGKFMLNRVIESNMKVLAIKDRIITAEVSTRSLNSPLRDCHVCKEVVKYKFKAGDLIRVE